MRLTSIESSFHPCNIYRDCPTGVPRGGQNETDVRSVGDSHPSASCDFDQPCWQGCVWAFIVGATSAPTMKVGGTWATKNQNGQTFIASAFLVTFKLHHFCLLQIHFRGDTGTTMFSSASHATPRYTPACSPILVHCITIRRYFAVSAPAAWNQLSPDIRNLQSLCSFKSKLNTCLIVTDMTRHHLISRYIDNSRPCNGWWCSMSRRVRNCRFIIIIIIIIIITMFHVVRCVKCATVQTTECTTVRTECRCNLTRSCWRRWAKKTRSLLLRKWCVTTVTETCTLTVR